MLGVAHTLLGILTVFAWELAGDLACTFHSLLSVLVVATALAATTHHTKGTLGSLRGALTNLCALLNLLLVRHPAGEVLSLAHPLAGLTSTRVRFLSPVGLLRLRGTLKRHKLGVLHGAELSGLLVESLLKKGGDVHATVTGDNNGSLNIDGETGVTGSGVSGVDGLPDAIGHVASVTVSLVGMTLSSVAVSAVSGAMGKIRREFTMCVEERDTIGPHTMSLEVLRDVDFMQGSFDISFHVVLSDRVGEIEVVHGLNELTADLLEVVSREAALLVERLEVVEVLSGVVELVHDCLVVSNRVRMQVSHAPGEIVGSRVEHLGDGSHELLVVIMLVDNGVGSVVVGSGVSLMVDGVIKCGLQTVIDGTAVLRMVGLRVVHVASVAVHVVSVAMHVVLVNGSGVGVMRSCKICHVKIKKVLLL